jgi:signal transduction histidine kinase
LPVFRIVQEALTNVARHAQASQVCIELSAHDDALYVRVSDDGIGFDPTRAGAQGHFGVLGMHERAAIQGGSIRWSAPPGGGTTLELRVPRTAPATDALPSCDECAVLRRMGAH